MIDSNYKEKPCPVCGFELTLKEFPFVKWKRACNNPDVEVSHYYENSNGKMRAVYPTHGIINRRHSENKLYKITDGNWKIIYESDHFISFNDNLDFLIEFFQNQDLLS